MNQNTKLVVMIALLAMNTTVALAKDAPATKPKDPLLITLTQKRIVTDAKGNEKSEEVPKVKPGDVIEYTAVYHNRGSAAITGLNASLPIPKGLVYIPKTAKPATALATANGTKYSAIPLMRTEKTKEGTEKTVEVPYAEYRSLRWEVGTLNANQQVTVSARARVESAVKAPEELVKP